MNYEKYTPALWFWGFLSVFIMFAYCMWQMPKDFRKGVMPRLMEIQKQNEESMNVLSYKIDIAHGMLSGLENIMRDK